jgi:predicted O-methyltransferase YrrM
MSEQKRELPELLSELLTAVLCSNLTDEEQLLVDRIESRRSQLLKSTEPLTYVEVGALASDAPKNLNDYRKTKTVGEICRISKSPRWAPLLFRIMRECRPNNCLELGAAVGISAAYHRSGLQVNGKGNLTIIEGAEAFGRIVDETLLDLGLEDRTKLLIGTFDSQLPVVLDEYGPFDYIFLDGQHTYEATIRFFEMFKGGVTDPALIVFDDIDWSHSGMDRAWNEIVHDNVVTAAIHLGPMGCCIVGSGIRLSFRPINMFPQDGRV